MRNICVLGIALSTLVGCAVEDMTEEPVRDDIVEDLPDQPIVSEPIDYKPYQFGSTVVAGGAGSRITNIESSLTHTCYLRGIRGALKGTEDVWGDRKKAWVRLEINEATWRWEAKTNPGYGTSVYADISCVRSTYKRKFLFRYGNNGNEVPNSEATSMTRCFLTGIEARGQAMHFRDWDNSLPGVKVSTDNGSWQVGVWFSDNGDGYIDGSAYAVCFDDAGGTIPLHYIENGSDEIHGGSASEWACGAVGIFGIMKTGGTEVGARSHKVGDRWWATGTANRGVLTRCYE